MTRTVTIDLDEPGDVERVWQALERRRAVRRINPELRHAIKVRCARLTPEVAEPILRALDEQHPEAVLAAFFDVLAPDKPTIGAVFRRRERPPTVQP